MTIFVPRNADSAAFSVGDPISIEESKYEIKEIIVNDDEPNWIAWRLQEM